MEESSFLNPGKILATSGLHEGMHVADFAAASGFFVRAAARLVGPQGSVWAVDLDREHLPRIKNLATAEGSHHVEVVQGNIAQVKGSHLPDEAMDFIILANTLFTHEPKEYAAVLKEVERVLKTGGLALIVDWTDSHGGLGPHPDHVITEATCKGLLAKAGLTVVHTTPAGSYHWGLIVRKMVSKTAQ